MAGNPELLHLTGTDAALAEFETEDVLARLPDAPAARPAVEKGARPRALPIRRTITVVTATVAAVTVVLVAMGTRREPTPRAAPLPRAAAARVAESVAPRAPDASGRVLSGSWRLTSRVGDTSVPRFRGLELEYELRLEQMGDQLRGSGVKATENGRVLSSRARTPIAVEGTIDGQTVRLAFTESGLARTSRGLFSLRLAADGSLAGGFWSDAARSSGTVTALREPRPR